MPATEANFTRLEGQRTAKRKKTDWRKSSESTLFSRMGTFDRKIESQGADEMQFDTNPLVRPHSEMTIHYRVEQKRYQVFVSDSAYPN
jgi:hypothetical protein